MAKERAAHPLLARVSGALSPRRARAAAPLLDLLARRLAALAAIAEGRPGPPGGRAAQRARWRRFLRAYEGSWHDGDENLVRGLVDRWIRPGQDPRVAAARGLLHAAEELARIAPRPETLWFYLWEMESLFSGLAPGPGPRARIRAVRKRTPWRS